MKEREREEHVGLVWHELNFLTLVFGNFLDIALDNSWDSLA